MAAAPAEVTKEKRKIEPESSGAGSKKRNSKLTEGFDPEAMGCNDAGTDREGRKNMLAEALNGRGPVSLNSRKRNPKEEDASGNEDDASAKKARSTIAQVCLESEEVVRQQQQEWNYWKRCWVFERPPANHSGSWQ